MRAITSQTAAQVLAITPKQLANLLLRTGAGAISAPGRQGRERRIPIRALPELALTLELITELGLGVREAHRIAAELLATPDADPGGLGAPLHPASYRAGHLLISADLGALVAQIDQRLGAAIETTVRPRRGRPPRK